MSVKVILLPHPGLSTFLLLLWLLLNNSAAPGHLVLGALLGVLSFLSILKIHRNDETCTNCQKCTRTCPVDIKVHKTLSVISDECHACLKCVAVCPEKDTLYISATKRKAILRPWGLHNSHLPAIYWRSAGGQSDRLLANRHFRQGIFIPCA